MTLIKLSLLFLLVGGSAFAQHFSHPVMVSRDDASLTRRRYSIVADTIDILVAMVQFQQDNTTLTSGDGRFDLSSGSDPVIDAPPHNRQYVADHFKFAENYYRKASRGKVVLRTTVLDSIITLPGVMQDYSPPRTGSTIAVGNLARDTWQRVDVAGMVANFSQYECFVVAHAGVGRDIDLVSLLGYDPTPYDIPSLYIGLSGFRQYYGPDYLGIPVTGGYITNTIILPESESRVLPTVTGTALLELSTNGLLCASIGNHLGLPDLFDTNTGNSGIGRFGLMDGQAIFSFSGTFPPEPSAWEKYWLGWVEPITLPAGEWTISLPAVSLTDAIHQVDTIYRVPISAQEYFLIENRNRDARRQVDSIRNGQTVTYTFNGQTIVRTFAKDTSDFYAGNISALAGVVIDVEDLDWSLPGGFDGTTFYDGGVLIWHIDEAVIAQGLLTNGVNANRDRRGVDVEEADGSQDIGYQYELFSAGSGSEEGTALDFWYLGNGSPVNHNVFSHTSHPDSRSNSGANSHITISNFSSRGPHMTAKVKVGDGVVQLLSGFPKQVSQQLSFPSLTVGQIAGDGNPEIIVTTDGALSSKPNRTGIPAPSLGGEIYAWRSDGTPALPVASSNGLFAQLGITSSGYSGAVAVYELNHDSIPEVVVGTFHPTLALRFVNAYSAVPRAIDSLAQGYFSQPSSINLVTSPAIGDSTIAVGSTEGKVLFLRFDGTLIDSTQVISDPLISGVSLNSSPNEFIITGSSGTLSIVRRGPVPTLLGARNFGSEIAGPAVAGVVGSGSDVRIAFATKDGRLFLLNNLLEPLPHFPVNTGGIISNSPAIADVDGDGIRDIIVFSGNKIHIYNYAGTSLDFFPVTVAGTIASYPVVGDINDDGNVEVVAVTSDGLVVAYGKDGRMAPGFPLQAGTGSQSVAVFAIQTQQLSTTEIGLAVASSDAGSVIAWKTGSVKGNRSPNLPWSQYQHDARHTGLAIEPITGTPLSSEFFPKGRAYNWPNPVYEGKTFIRYFVKDNAAVNIKILDLAGDLVTTIPNPPGVGGVDNEVEWNVADVQSGIYFARIEASGVSGNGVAVVKIAIVK